MVHSIDGLVDPPKKMKLTLRIQKNCQNGQSITFASNDKHLHICPVGAAYQIYLRAKRLGQLDDQPMGIFMNKQGISKYLTANKISEVLQSVAKTCHPDLSRDKIMRFSSHSIRVWAVVLPDEAGMNPDFIKSRLRWMGDSYRLYLRDTVILQINHINALERASDEFSTLFGENRTTLPDVVPLDDNMGQFFKYQYIFTISCIIYLFYFLFLFLFIACLQYIAAMSYLRQKCTWPTSFYFVIHDCKEACMP